MLFCISFCLAPIFCSSDYFRNGAIFSLVKLTYIFQLNNLFRKTIQIINCYKASCGAGNLWFDHHLNFTNFKSLTYLKEVSNFWPPHSQIRHILCLLRVDNGRWLRGFLLCLYVISSVYNLFCFMWLAKAWSWRWCDFVIFLQTCFVTPRRRPLASYYYPITIGGWGPRVVRLIYRPAGGILF